MPSVSPKTLLAGLLQALDGPAPLVILPHDNPDPDALASAAALKFLVQELIGKGAVIAQGGIVGRAEDRAMLTYLNIGLRPVGELALTADVRVALVDTQPGRTNNSLPTGVVAGLDADPDMLKVARYKSAKENIPVKFDVGMTYSLPYPDASFDRVLSSIMIHHLNTPDKKRTAREVFRILKPGGRLHIVDFGKPVTWYGKLLGPFLHGFEEANDNIEGSLPVFFGEPGLQTRISGNFWTFFGDLAFLRGDKAAD